MLESGIINQNEYRRFPQITSAEANDKNIFMPGQKGAAYSSSTINATMLHLLSDATPTQMALLEDRYKVWRMTYNKELAREAPAFGKFVDGWRERIFGDDDSPAPARQNLPPRQAQRSVPKPTSVALSLDVQAQNFISGKLISIEIPGKGVFNYTIDNESNSFVKSVGPIPAGIQVIPSGPYAEGLKSTRIRWTDAKGGVNTLELAPIVNERIANSSLSVAIFGMPVSAPFGSRALMDLPADSDNLVLLNNGRFRVEDTKDPQLPPVSRTSTTNGPSNPRSSR